MATKSYTPKKFAASVAEDARFWADSYRGEPGEAERWLDNGGSFRGDVCIFTGEPVTEGARDHLIPTSMGGITVPGNLIRSSRRSNFTRSNATAIDHWRSMASEDRLYKTEAEFLEALEIIQTPYRENYPEEFAMANGILANNEASWSEFYRRVAEHASTNPKFDGLADKTALIDSFQQFYRSSRDRIDSKQSTYDRFAARSDNYAKVIVKLADSCESPTKSYRNSFRSSISTSAKKLEKAVDFSAKKKQRLRDLKAFLDSSGFSNESSLQPYLKILIALDESNALIEAIRAKGTELRRATSNELSKKKRSASHVSKMILNGESFVVNSQVNADIDFALTAADTNTLAPMRNLRAALMAGEVSLPQSYEPAASAKKALNRLTRTN